MIVEVPDGVVDGRSGQQHHFLVRAAPRQQPHQVAVAARARIGKAQVVRAIAQRCNMSLKDANYVYSIILRTIINELHTGSRVVLPGIGRFKKIAIAPRRFVKPGTGESVMSTRSSKISFRPSNYLKSEI
ncbi:HU family DNA-binding protein [Deinococcus sp. Marseille-Q6407]|uniref:HU family DNA-binding protein n=1 Tax=Deinococcus sp. Marseille-Q6407 TaxID=2969223 RepID=UPI0021C1EC79|nr:HU family DNA-binding protein [Deinococcus sp. Marseille-Q6407]